MPLKPERLCPGDTIGIVAPASPPPDPKAIDRAAAKIESLKFKVKLGRHLRKRYGFLAGYDDERAGDLMRMFEDQSIKAIICLRGGYGTSRLLNRLDFRSIRASRKILVGYSDITSLQCALLKKANLISFHGPMLNSELVRQDLPEFTLKSFLSTLCEAKPAGSICTGYRGKTVSVVRAGKARGRLFGGNLSILCGTLATPWQPMFHRRILFIEDLEEAPYRIDRMLTHLLNAGLLQQVAGVAVGINRNCVDPKARAAGEYRQTVEDVLRERLLPLRVPIVIGLPFGHVPFNATLPIGVEAELDGSGGDLIITESAVK